MTPKRILLPIDLTRCPLEVFEVVNGMAARADTTVILLYVVSLNILAPENRVYEELYGEALSYLQRLARLHLAASATPVFHVRFGHPAEVILAEAQAEHVDLIILPAPGPSLWDRLVSLWKDRGGHLFRPIVRQVIQHSTCGVFLLTTRSHFDCQRAWGSLAHAA